MEEKDLKDAKWYESLPEGKLVCRLCPKYCVIPKGGRGFCFVRENIGGSLKSLVYGHPESLAIDPIEKKPLYHFLPGTRIMSLGTLGCNMGCKFCQNSSLSSGRIMENPEMHMSPEDILGLAKKNRCPSIAFTYNEPTVFGEYLCDIAEIARPAGFKTVMVTNGFVSKEAREEIFRNIDAANVDLKSFSAKFYREIALGNLEAVLDTIMYLKNRTSLWLELTTLLIPGENDSPEEIKALCAWIVNNLGRDVPLHFSAFFPAYKMSDRMPTPFKTLSAAKGIAESEGIKYCYLGNIGRTEGSSTNCEKCGKALIERNYMQTSMNCMESGCCPSCGTKIPGVF